MFCGHICYCACNTKENTRQLYISNKYWLNTMIAAFYFISYCGQINKLCPFCYHYVFLQVHSSVLREVWLQGFWKCSELNRSIIWMHAGIPKCYWPEGFSFWFFLFQTVIDLKGRYYERSLLNQFFPLLGRLSKKKKKKLKADQVFTLNSHFSERIFFFFLKYWNKCKDLSEQGGFG